MFNIVPDYNSLAVHKETMISINCDIGERGADHPVDRELMNYLDIANLACGRRLAAANIQCC